MFKIFCIETKKEEGMLVVAYFSTLTTSAIGAFFLTDSIPFLQEASDS